MWLFVPPVDASCAACPSALATPASISASPSPNPDIALFVTSSGKPMPRPLSWRGWKTRPWIGRLYGTISNPSTADRGAAAWISSLPAIPVSHSALPVGGTANGIRVTYGPISSGSSANAAPGSSSPRMSKATSIWDLPKSRPAFADWAITQKRACLQREKRALAIAGDGFSSWPTPTATDAGYMPDLMVGGTIRPTSPHYTAESSAGQFSLTNAARSWTHLWQIMRAMGWTPVTMPRSPHPVRVSFSFGAGSSISGLISNPRFFDLMMGWPIGWSAPGERVTGFSAWQRRSRGALSALTLPGKDGGSDA